MQIAHSNRRKGTIFFAVAAVGLAIVAWKWRSNISKFLSQFVSSESPNETETEKQLHKEPMKNSSPPPELAELDKEKPRKSADIAPESLKMSGETVEKTDGSEPEQKVGNCCAPEATE